MTSNCVTHGSMPYMGIAQSLMLYTLNLVATDLREIVEKTALKSL